MSTAKNDDALGPITRTLQIIVGALVTGLVTFLFIVLFVMKPMEPPKPAPNATPAAPQPLITYVALLVAAVDWPLSFLVPAFMVKSQRRRIANGTWNVPQQGPGVPSAPSGELDDKTKLVMVYQTQMIIGAAVNEGAAFLALIAYMLERQQIALMLALALIIAVAVRFPTRDRVSQWIEHQLGLLHQERQFGT